MSTSPEIVPISETISQTAQEGLGVGVQVIAKSEMPGIGHSGETRQPGEEDLRPGQDVRLSTTPEVGQYPVETSQPVVSGSTSETRLDEIPTAGPKLQSVSEKKSVEVQLFEASKDSKWFDAIEKKNCKLLLQLFRDDPSLWVQTGLKGRSVLHVAVMQGCLELVRELHYYKGDLAPCCEFCRTPFEFLWEHARDGRLKGASAQDIWLVVEGPSEVSRKFRRRRDDYIESHLNIVSDREEREMLRLRETISRIASEKEFVMDENDVDFNFENAERKELYVHMACSMLRNFADEEVLKSPRCDQIREFIMAVIIDLSEKKLLQRLFDQMDAQGRTILQILVGASAQFSEFLNKMLEMLPKACVNARDKAGRTVLHWAVGHNFTWAVRILFYSGKVSYRRTFDSVFYKNISALSLMLFYEYGFDPYEKWVRKLVYLLQNEPLERWQQSTLPYRATLHTLSYAVLLGKNEFVNRIMATEEYEKHCLHKNQLLSCAAFSGNVRILQILLEKANVNKLNGFYDPFGAPLLHLAVEAIPNIFWPDSRDFNDILHCNDFISIDLLESELLKQDLEKQNAVANTYRSQYIGKRVCANLLLQAGVDILATDKDGQMADPGANAPIEARLWWYELVAKLTFNIKKDINVAGNGTAIVAALVATASFVGPLTPPLNYVAMSSGTATVDVGVQVTEFLIKVFLVSNSLSFYLAITSIMLAIMPSLPIPKEGLVSGPCGEMKRSQRTISIAIGMLLASIISVLISFATSSLIVIPLQHRKLMAYSTSIGGLICFIGIIFFFLRFLRLIGPQNTVINKLYQRYGIL